VDITMEQGETLLSVTCLMTQHTGYPQ